MLRWLKSLVQTRSAAVKRRRGTLVPHSDVFAESSKDCQFFSWTRGLKVVLLKLEFRQGFFLFGTETPDTQIHMTRHVRDTGKH